MSRREKVVMRASLVAVCLGVVLSTAPAASAKDAGFLDLPGIGALQRMSGTQASTAPTGTTATNDVKAPAARTPDAATAKATSTSGAGSATAADTAMIRSLPGGSHLPVLGVDATAASARGGAGMAFALALGVMVLFTRFLFRLNTLGHTA